MKKKPCGKHLPFNERIDKQLKQIGLSDKQLLNAKRKIQKRRQLVEEVKLWLFCLDALKKILQCF